MTMNKRHETPLSSMNGYLGAGAGLLAAALSHRLTGACPPASRASAAPMEIVRSPTKEIAIRTRPRS